jgi:ATP-binding protein involved in chromosome partitioning
MPLDQQTVLRLLHDLRVPGTSTSLVEAGVVRDITVEGGRVTVLLAVEASRPQTPRELKQLVEAALAAHPEVTEHTVKVQTMLATAAPAPPPRPTWADRITGIRHVVAVASGKGGVGKSTVAANLALALAADGRAVGLLDADIYGPSQQLMMGATGEPRATADGKIVPMDAPGGVRVMSFGYIIDADQPVIWRGPMLQKALEQFVGDVQWGELDYLVVDLPPGTGDVALTLCQNVPMAGAVIVSTPQDVALIDARKGLNMFRKLEVPVLGIVENMSHYVCPKCGHVEHVFGADGGRRTAEQLGLPFLGAIPLDPEVVAGGDRGTPVVREHPDSPAGQAFLAAARALRDVVEATGTGG